MDLPAARKLARKTADDTNTITYVYLDTHKRDLDYDVAFSVPAFGIKTGDPYLPIKKHREAQVAAILSPPIVDHPSPGPGVQSAHAAE